MESGEYLGGQAKHPQQIQTAKIKQTAAHTLLSHDSKHLSNKGEE